MTLLRDPGVQEILADREFMAEMRAALRDPAVAERMVESGEVTPDVVALFQIQEVCPGTGSTDPICGMLEAMTRVQTTTPPTAAPARTFFPAQPDAAAGPPRSVQEILARLRGAPAQARVAALAEPRSGRTDRAGRTGRPCAAEDADCNMERISGQADTLRSAASSRSLFSVSYAAPRPTAEFGARLTGHRRQRRRVIEPRSLTLSMGRSFRVVSPEELAFGVDSAAAAAAGAGAAAARRGGTGPPPGQVCLPQLGLALGALLLVLGLVSALLAAAVMYVRLNRHRNSERTRDDHLYYK